MTLRQHLVAGTVQTPGCQIDLIESLVFNKGIHDNQDVGVVFDLAWCLNALDEKLHCHICSKNFSSRWDLRWKEISKHEFVLLSKKCHWAICLGKNIMWIIFLGTTYSTISNLFIRMKEGRTSTFLILIIRMIKKAQKKKTLLMRVAFYQQTFLFANLFKSCLYANLDLPRIKINHCLPNNGKSLEPLFSDLLIT